MDAELVKEGCDIYHRMRASCWMRILCVGYGSIGRTHINALASIGNHDLAVLRSGIGAAASPTGVNVFTRLVDAIDFKADGVIIASPTALHVEHALPFARQGAAILIEKPLSGQTCEIDVLGAYRDRIAVAYCLRYHPLYKELRQIVHRSLPIKINFRRSFYLPHWHPNSDYRFEYVARRILGGGVLRTLSHEIDLCIDWFGAPKSVAGVVDKVSSLEVDTEDCAFVSMKFTTGVRVNIDLDLFSPTNQNDGQLFTNEETYSWDMSNIVVEKMKNPGIRINLLNLKEDGVSIMYRDQMRDFIHFVAGEKSGLATFEEALLTMNVIEAVEQESSRFAS